MATAIKNARQEESLPTFQIDVGNSQALISSWSSTCSQISLNGSVTHDRDIKISLERRVTPSEFESISEHFREFVSQECGFYYSKAQDGTRGYTIFHRVQRFSISDYSVSQNLGNDLIIRGEFASLGTSGDVLRDYMRSITKP